MHGVLMFAERVVVVVHRPALVTRIESSHVGALLVLPQAAHVPEHSVAL